MRTHILLAAAFVSAPLTAQTPVIAPAPSVLFAPAAKIAPARASQAADTAFHQDAGTVGTGLGVLAGSAVIYALSRTVHAGGCEDIAPSDCPEHWHPGVGGYLLGMATGGVVGYLVGSALHSGPAPE